MKQGEKANVMVGGDYKRRYYNQYREQIGYTDHDSIHTAYANDVSAFLSYAYHFTKKFSIKLGAHYLYNGISEKSRIEPRVELNYQIKSTGNIYCAFREQSTNVPFAYHYSYDYYKRDYPIREKVLLPLMKSRHLVLGWNNSYKKGVSIGSELFYQYLYDYLGFVYDEGYTEAMNPFSTTTLGISEGSIEGLSSGRNYGVELSLDAPITSHNIYFYLAGTLFNSEVKVEDKWTPSLYNSTFGVTSALRKYFPLSQRTKLTSNANYTLQGGRRYTPRDEQKSEEQQRIVLDETRVNECQHQNYSRLDLALSVSHSSKSNKFSHSFSVEAQNALNTENILEVLELYEHPSTVINQIERVFVYKYIFSF